MILLEKFKDYIVDCFEAESDAVKRDIFYQCYHYVRNKPNLAGAKFGLVQRLKYLQSVLKHAGDYPSEVTIDRELVLTHIDTVKSLISKIEEGVF